MISFKPNTQIEVHAPKSEYIKGEGSQTTYEAITYTLCGNKNPAFYCEWRGSFGADVLTADSMNIKDLATIRMPFNPDIYAALRQKQVKILRAGDDEPFEVVGSPDNYLMQNRMLEFKVKRMEGK